MSGAPVARLELDGWLVDPAAGRSGPGSLVVVEGRIASVTWAPAADRPASTRLVVPGFIELSAHVREPGHEDAETVATALAAAARGGFTTICATADTDPATDTPGAVDRLRSLAAASGSPVALRAWGALSTGRGGEGLAPLAELADAGVVGFSDAPAAVRSMALLRNALLYAGSLGRPVGIVADDPALTGDAEAGEGLVATVLGLRGAPVAAEAGSLARALAVLADVVEAGSPVRLHVAQVSTAAGVAAIRSAKAAGLPVTADVAPHHLALSDEWLAGARRWAWDAVDPDGRRRDPWRDGALEAPPFHAGLRVRPPLRSPADAVACLAGLADGTLDAIAADHAPQSAVERHVEFGEAPAGIAGLETALGLVLAAVDAGRLPLERAIAACTTGPASVLPTGSVAAPGLREGMPADLVVVDRAASWTVDPARLATLDRWTPLAGRTLPGVVERVIAGGRAAVEP